MDEWLQFRGIEKGAVLGMEQAWGFTKDWYADRATRNWQPKTAEQMRAIFEKNGLTGDFWEIGSEESSFES